jgi:hypothetical protein
MNFDPEEQDRVGPADGPWQSTSVTNSETMALNLAAHMGSTVYSHQYSLYERLVDVLTCTTYAS